MTSSTEPGAPHGPHEDTFAGAFASRFGVDAASLVEVPGFFPPKVSTIYGWGMKGDAHDVTLYLSRDTDTANEAGDLRLGFYPHPLTDLEWRGMDADAREWVMRVLHQTTNLPHTRAHTVVEMANAWAAAHASSEFNDQCAAHCVVAALVEHETGISTGASTSGILKGGQAIDETKILAAGFSPAAVALLVSRF